MKISRDTPFARRPTDFNPPDFERALPDSLNFGLGEPD